MGYQSILRGNCFAGEVHVVTGGGSGIGRCVAHELSSLGAHVVITGRKQEKLDAVLREIAEDGGSADSQAFDIRDEEAVIAAIGIIVAKHGRIHGLINNAGGQYPAPLESITKKGWEAVVSNNLTGGFLVMREVYNQSMKGHGGAVVNMAAECDNGKPAMAHSGAARAGMINLTKSAAVAWGVAGVRVNCVAAGFIASSGLDTYKGEAREVMKRLKNHVPISRLAAEAEVSALICFLLSPGAAYITGATIPIDGGSSLGSPMFALHKGRSTPVFDGYHRAVVPKVLTEDDA